MEITVCDATTFMGKLIIDQEITCKDLKDKIASQFRRDMSYCTIYHDKKALEDNSMIIPDSTAPYIIIDKDITTTTSNLDCHYFLYSSPRFTKNPQFYPQRCDPHIAIFFDGPFHSNSNSDASSDYEDVTDEEDNMLIIPDNDNNSDENSDTDIYLPGPNFTDSDNEYENANNHSDGEDYISLDTSEEVIDLVSQYDERRNNRNSSRNDNGEEQNNSSSYQSQTSTNQNNDSNSSLRTYSPRTPPLISSADIFHPTDILSVIQDDDENMDQLNIALSPEEEETIRRICSETQNFDRFTVIQVFEACGRDAETTIQCLSTM